jgi:hypothetical protein
MIQRKPERLTFIKWTTWAMENYATSKKHETVKGYKSLDV